MRGRITSGLAFCVGIALSGCSQGPTQKATDNPIVEEAKGHEDKIREALKKAGVTNQVVAILDGGEEWICVIAVDGADANGAPPPGTRPIPERARVDKKTYKVTRDNPGGGPGDNRGGGGKKGSSGSVING